VGFVKKNTILITFSLSADISRAGHAYAHKPPKKISSKSTACIGLSWETFINSIGRMRPFFQAWSSFLA
jgi:hypothetical protein